MDTMLRMVASFQAQSAKYYRVARELRDDGEYEQAIVWQRSADTIARNARNILFQLTGGVI